MTTVVSHRLIVLNSAPPGFANTYKEPKLEVVQFPHKRVRYLTLLSAAALCWFVWCGAALAAQTVKLTVGFTPNRPNASTTIHFGYAVVAPHGAVPTPVTDVALELPVGMGLGLMTLGEDVCRPLILEAQGFGACPPNALMGRGHAVIALPVGKDTLHVAASVKIFMGVPRHNHTVILFNLASTTPVWAEGFFPSELIPVNRGLSASLETLIPIIPTWPGGLDATLVEMNSTLGPEHLTYYRYVHGKRVGYHPVGMAVPAVCPHGGYRFVVHVSFEDGTRSSATSRVPCRS